MRVERKNEIRVVVFPKVHASGDWNATFQSLHVASAETERYFLAEAESIKRQILRHIDFEGQASITWDSVTVCSFCGDEDDSKTFPWCCEAAQLEWLAANPDVVEDTWGDDEKVAIADLRAKLVNA